MNGHTFILLIFAVDEPKWLLPEVLPPPPSLHHEAESWHLAGTVTD